MLSLEISILNNFVGKEIYYLGKFRKIIAFIPYINAFGLVKNVQIKHYGIDKWLDLVNDINALSYQYIINDRLC